MFPLSLETFFFPKTYFYLLITNFHCYRSILSIEMEGSDTIWLIPSLFDRDHCLTVLFPIERSSITHPILSFSTESLRIHTFSRSPVPTFLVVFSSHSRPSSTPLFHVPNFCRTYLYLLSDLSMTLVNLSPTEDLDSLLSLSRYTALRLHVSHCSESELCVEIWVWWWIEIYAKGKWKPFFFWQMFTTYFGRVKKFLFILYKIE